MAAQRQHGSMRGVIAHAQPDVQASMDKVRQAQSAA